MGGFMLKVKTKQGQHVIDSLNANDTIANFKTKISEVTHIPSDGLNILIGFPPKPLDLSANDKTISGSGVNNGDTLIVEEKVLPDVVANTSCAQIEEDLLLAQRLAAGEETFESQGILLKQVVPSDNSCLFTSIGYVMNGKIDTDIGTNLREVIAQHVANDPTQYNEAFLGKPNDEYGNWIRLSSSWGGAIEVSILSNYFGIEFAVIDITNALINRFGEDKDFGMRAFLLFDGIHYDPLYLESLSGETPKTIFPVEDSNVFKQAEQLALEAKSSRQFTDVDKFTLRCIQCDVMLTGQVEAQSHAKTTGHTNFGEV